MQRPPFDMGNAVDRLKQQFGAVQGRDLRPGSRELRSEPEVAKQPDGSYAVLGLLNPGGSFHCTVKKVGDGYQVIDPYVDWQPAREWYVRRTHPGGRCAFSSGQGGLIPLLCRR